MGLREASGFEGLIILGVIYFILSRLQKVGKQVGRSPGQPPDRQPPAGVRGAPEQEGSALETILKEIERVKRQKQFERPEPARRPLADSRPELKPMAARRAGPPRRPDVVQDERGPLGRIARTRLESAEDVEVRTSLEDQGSLEITDASEIAEDLWRKRQRVVVDADEQAEAVAQRRLQEVEARNRPHADADHRAFDQRVRTGEEAPGAPGRYSSAQLRQALVWREILGPPKALEE